MSKTKVSLIRDQFPVWFRREKKRDNLPDEMNEEVLRDFFDFLGFKDDSFVDVPDKYYDSRYHEGTKWIEDYIKKKIFRSEEKPVAHPKASVTKRPPVGKMATGKSDDNQIDTNASPVKVEAIGHVHMGDEKVMPYRKDMTLASDIDANDPSDDSFSGVTSEVPNKVGFNVDTHKKLIKDIIAGLLEGQLTAEFKHVQFTWNKLEGPQFYTVMDPAFVKKQ